MVESVKELWKICYEKRYVYRAWYNKYVSKVSIYVTWLLLHTPVTPDFVTICELFLVILASIFLFIGKLEYVFIGLLIIQFTNLLDCVDGELARYKKIQSLVGMHLEDIYHQLVSHLMFFPLAFGIFTQTSWKSVLIFGFICSIFSTSIVIPTILSTIFESKLYNISKSNYLKKKTDKKIKNRHINLQGSKLGKKLSDIYDKFKDFWSAPTNILHLTIISIIELVNMLYQFLPNYTIFYWYLAAYATVAILTQTISFIVNYRGRAVEQYYKSLFVHK